MPIDTINRYMIERKIDGNSCYNKSTPLSADIYFSSSFLVWNIGDAYDFFSIQNFSPNTFSNKITIDDKKDERNKQKWEEGNSEKING